MQRALPYTNPCLLSGRYRVEGQDFVTVVEVSWNEEWNGTEQRRHFRIDSKRLLIESEPGPSILFRVEESSAGSYGSARTNGG